MKSGVYRIVNNLNGDFYIGSSKNLEKRFRQHKATFKQNKTILQRAFNKYGINNFSFEPIDECLESELIEKEQLYLDSFKPKYNIMTKAFSYHNYRHTEESKIKAITNRSKIGEDTILNIIKDIKSLKTTGQILKDYSISRGYLNYIVRGEKWKHLTNTITDEDRSKFKLNNKLKAIEIDRLRKTKNKKSGS